MALYNMTHLQDSETMFKLIQFADDATGNILMPLFLLAVFFIGILALKRYEFKDGFAVMSFICFIIALMLQFAGLLNVMYVILPLTATVLSVLFMFAKKD